MEMFIKRSQFKPEKKNIAVINFCDRLRKEGRVPPRAYEKFEYVFVRRDNIEFNENGCNADISSASYMELYEFAMEKKMTINVGKYMTGEICSELGQYMCCCDKYRIEPTFPFDKSMLVSRLNDSTVEEVMRVAEDATQNAGREYIEQLCDQASDVLAKSVRKPIYVGIKKCIDGYVTRKITRPNGLDLRRMKFITKLSETAGETAFDVFMSQIAMEARKQSKLLFENMCQMHATNLETPSGIIKLRIQLMDEHSPKMIFNKSFAVIREQLHTKLQEYSVLIDQFAKWHNTEYIIRLSQAARNKVGLDKPIISLKDVTTASQMMNAGMLCDLNVEIPATITVPTGDMFRECESLVNQLIDIEKQVITFDTFGDYVLTKMEQVTRAGQSADKYQIADDINDVATISMPDAIHEV
jgi:hypothetical protein